MSTLPRFGVTELAASQAIPETTVNENLRYVSQGAGHFVFIDRDLTAPPGSPADGDCYLVATGGTGAWSGHDGDIAFYLSTSWAFIEPLEGFTAGVQDENAAIAFLGGSWTTLATGAGYTDEQARDAIGTALVEGAGIDITVNDGADTITIASTLTQYTDEMARDAIGAALTDSSTIDFTANDGADTLTASVIMSAIKPTESLVIACSDETTAITTGTAKVTFRMPYAFTLTAVRASVTTAPTGSTIIIDINEGGTTILSTKLSIDASEKTSTTAASAAVISDTALADDAEITIDFDQVGSTIAGAGVKVYLIGTRT